MWTPNYIISSILLRTIRDIGESLGTIKAQSPSSLRLGALLGEARALSTFASTSIEGNPLPLTDVRRILKNTPEHIRDTEREILNYNHALEWIQDQISAGKFRFNAENFCRIQAMVTDGLMENPSDIGKFRQKPVVIRDPRIPDSVVFIPPNHQDVARLCHQMFAFIDAARLDTDPIILAGLFHKQSVIIHPFMDGNGRSTRLMTSALLGMMGFDFWSLFSFEAYYSRNVTRYFQIVGQQGDYYDLPGNMDFTPWLEYFSEGILDELKRVEKALPNPAPRLMPHHSEIIAYIQANGSISQREYANISTRSLAARKKDFIWLLNHGLVQKIGSGRGVHYTLPDTRQD
jgi:Fic family protein